mmetsp:Transcript_4746/g.20298  ORF Transcript_4746/g.20298 Transcript_4746/m.20298 type:complete len:516 (-) Transcript_4746:134-1681(-)
MYVLGGRVRRFRRPGGLSLDEGVQRPEPARVGEDCRVEEELEAEQQAEAGEPERDAGRGEEPRGGLLAEAQPQKPHDYACKWQGGEAEALGRRESGVQGRGPEVARHDHVVGEDGCAIVVHGGLESVVLADEIVLHPVQNELRDDDHACPAEPGTHAVGRPGVLHDGEAEEEEEVEALHRVRADSLEQHLVANALEHGRLELHEVVGYQQGSEGVAVGVERDAEADELHEHDRAVHGCHCRGARDLHDQPHRLPRRPARRGPLPVFVQPDVRQHHRSPVHVVHHLEAKRGHQLVGHFEDVEQHVKLHRGALAPDGVVHPPYLELGERIDPQERRGKAQSVEEVRAVQPGVQTRSAKQLHDAADHRRRHTDRQQRHHVEQVVQGDDHAEPQALFQVPRHLKHQRHRRRHIGEGLVRLHRAPVQGPEQKLEGAKPAVVTGWRFRSVRGRGHVAGRRSRRRPVAREASAPRRALSQPVRESPAAVLRPRKGALGVGWVQLFRLRKRANALRPGRGGLS